MTNWAQRRSPAAGFAVYDPRVASPPASPRYLAFSLPPSYATERWPASQHDVTWDREPARRDVWPRAGATWRRVAESVREVWAREPRATRRWVAEWLLLLKPPGREAYNKEVPLRLARLPELLHGGASR